MKVAVAGKGGSGKTSISGTMARLLGAQHRGLALDGFVDLWPSRP